MASQSQYLIRNRHSNQWYGRVVIPILLRPLFDGKREVRRSLQTSNKTIAKRRALAFWLQCQTNFERVQQNGNSVVNIPKLIRTTDILGRLHEDGIQNQVSARFRIFFPCQSQNAGRHID